jgi:hypothetical protein
MFHVKRLRQIWHFGNSGELRVQQFRDDVATLPNRELGVNSMVKGIMLKKNITNQ